MRPGRRKNIYFMRDGRPQVSTVSLISKSKTRPRKTLPRSRLMAETDEADETVFAIPRQFVTAPRIKDALTTRTSRDQDETIRECLPLLKASGDPTRDPFDFSEHGLPRLERTNHIRYLHESLQEFPAPYVGVDASRPWMVYWALMGLSLLGEDITLYRSRVIKTFTSMQNATGGFGGGQGQYSHLAGTYAALLSIALVGGDEAYSLVDRDSMWHWLGRLKQANGGFEVCEGGEEDVRGAYCALVALSLLNLPSELPPDAPARHAGLETFMDGLGPYLSRCQTYEGGLAAEPGNEAHGAYAFCALACLCLLGEPHHTMSSHLDVPSLLQWLSSRQYAPEGGFAGRTNKLVDGCYSHWLGGCWPLVQAVLNGPFPAGQTPSVATVGSLYSREGLTRYTLCCCQLKTGGLRDKPSKRVDSYHTCYTLAGLSALQYFHFYEHTTEAHPFASAFAWRCLETHPVAVGDAGGEVFDEGDRLRSFHPVYVIPHDAVTALHTWAERQPISG